MLSEFVHGAMLLGIRCAQRAFVLRGRHPPADRIVFVEVDVHRADWMPKDNPYATPMADPPALPSRAGAACGLFQRSNAFRYRLVMARWHCRVRGPPILASNVAGREKAVMVK